MSFQQCRTAILMGLLLVAGCYVQEHQAYSQTNPRINRNGPEPSVLRTSQLARAPQGNDEERPNPSRTAVEADQHGEDPTSRAARLKLMGDKALAEFKADKLSKRVEALERGLKQKEDELIKIRSSAGEKESQVATLTEQLKELQESAQARDAELQSKLTELAARLQDRSEEAKRLKRQLGESQELLSALKSATTDSNRLKDEAEEEITKLRTRINELESQLKVTTEAAERYKQEYHTLVVQTKPMAKELAQYKTENITMKDQLTQLGSHAEQIREAAEQLQTERNRYAQEVETLKAQLKSLSSRTAQPQQRPQQQQPPTVKPAEEEEGGPIDSVLQVPPPKAEAKPKPTRGRKRDMNLF